MSISGVGSGQSDYIQQLLWLEAQPLRDLQSRRGDLDVRLGILSDLRTKVGAFRSLIAGFAEMGSASALRRFTASCSDESVATASASATAASGSHTLTVSLLAQAHKIASSGFVGTDTDFSPGDYTFEITVGDTATEISVEISDGDDNAAAMQKVVEAIRSAGAGLSADLVTVDSVTQTKKIVVSSTDSGTANLIASVQDTTGTLMGDLGLSGTSEVGSFSANTTVQAQDATFELDGIPMISSDNEIEDVLTGVVLNLRDRTEGTEVVTLTIGYDEEAVRDTLDKMVSAFNELMSYLNSKLVSGDETGAGRGELAGDLTFVSFRSQLKQHLVSAVTGLSGEINSLDDIGIGYSRDGTLSVSDFKKFFEELTTEPGDVEAFFASADGLATRLKDLAGAFTKMGGGLDLSRDLVESRKDVLDLRIERMESFLEIREKQILDELGRLSQFVAQLGYQQQAYGSLVSSNPFLSFFGG